MNRYERLSVAEHSQLGQHLHGMRIQADQLFEGLSGRLIKSSPEMREVVKIVSNVDRLRSLLEERMASETGETGSRIYYPASPGG